MGGDDVYIRSDEFAWVPARLVEQDATTAKVAIPQYENEEAIASDGGKAAIGFKSAIVKLKDYQGNVLPLQNVGGNGELIDADDMVDLPYLHEVSVYKYYIYIYTFVFVCLSSSNVTGRRICYLIDLLLIGSQGRVLKKNFYL